MMTIQNKLPVSLAVLTLLCFAQNARAVITNPNPAEFFDDFGIERFLPKDPVIAIEIDDPLEVLPSGSEFGFYFTSDPSTLITIFDPVDDLLSGVPQVAVIDFAAGEVFDTELLSVQSTFSGSGLIGFYMLLPDIVPAPLYSQSGLNPFGDVSASFQSIPDARRYLIGFEAPFDAGVFFGFHVIDGVTGVSEPATMLLLAGGLLALRIGRRRRR